MFTFLTTFSPKFVASIPLESETMWAIGLAGIVIGASITFIALRIIHRRQVTRLRADMERLKASEERVRMAFDGTYQFAGIVTPAGEIVEVNQSALAFGSVSIDDVRGKLLWESAWWAHSVELQALIKEAVMKAARGEFVQLENKHIGPGGDEHIVDFSIKPLTDENGKVIWLIPEGRDITDRKRIEQELRLAINAAESSNRAKSEFLANMSHEIRTPMTAILGYADMLVVDENTRDDEASRLFAVRTIKSNGEFLLQIINDILDLSKIEAGRMVAEKIECSLVEVVDEVATLMRVRAEEKKLALNVNYKTSIPDRILTDPGRLRQILVNLIGNGIKFTHHGSVTMEVSWSSAETGKLQIDVVDTGVGMSAEQTQGLFQAFSQADASTTRLYGGTGLGLTISRRLAEILGGDVVLARTSLGQGSCFRLTFNIDVPPNVNLTRPAQQITQSPSQPAKAASLKGIRILLAEDGLDNQRIIALMLRKAGAEVAVVENGKIAVETAQRSCENNEDYHVILMDMQMPVMDGYSAVRLLRSQNYNGKIIALTAHAMRGDRDACLLAGCDDYATKPIDRLALTTLIASHCEEMANS